MELRTSQVMKRRRQCYMNNLFQHVGKVVQEDSYAVTVTKIVDGLSSRTNKVVQRNMLLSNHPQGTKSFEK